MSGARIRQFSRWLAVALAAAVVAATMVVIFAAVRLAVRTDPVGALILLTVCLWIPEHLVVAYCYRRR